jgi:hypothetical protein
MAGIAEQHDAPAAPAVVRSRSKIGQTVTSVVTSMTRNRSAWKPSKHWNNSARELGSDAASLSNGARGTTPMT